VNERRILIDADEEADTMSKFVPFIAEAKIESAAAVLLDEYFSTRGVSIALPIPIEDIVEKHLKLGIEFDDTHRLFGLRKCRLRGHTTARSPRLREGVRKPLRRVTSTSPAFYVVPDTNSSTCGRARTRIIRITTAANTPGSAYNETRSSADSKTQRSEWHCSDRPADEYR